MAEPTTQPATHPLTPETILDAAEEVLRRYGPTKASVVDVAAALDVNHGSVSRHFAAYGLSSAGRACARRFAPFCPANGSSCGTAARRGAPK